MIKTFFIKPMKNTPTIADFNRLIYSQPIPPGAEVGHTSIHVKTLSMMKPIKVTVIN
jgi:hypothetical protein